MEKDIKISSALVNSFTSKFIWAALSGLSELPHNKPMQLGGGYIGWEMGEVWGTAERYDDISLYIHMKFSGVSKKYLKIQFHISPYIMSLYNHYHN